MKKDLVTRREAIHGGLLAIAGSALLACGKEKKEVSCMDTSGLKPDEVAMRTSLAYVDRTPDPAKTCSNCQFFRPAAPDQCGGCTLLKGPIHPRGYCKSWVQKQGG